MAEELEILYSDADLLAISKPPGLGVHAAPGPGSSVLRVLRERLGLTGLTPVHRLDKGVSGVLLLARGKDAARALERLWPSVEKVYLALCEGIPERPAGVVEAPILEHHTGKPERLEVALRYYRQHHPDAAVPEPPAPKTSAVHPAGRPAQTAYQVLRAFRGPAAWSWLELAPRQGRMHQVRVHLAHLGHPLAVDPLYGRRAVLTEADLRPGGSDRVVLARLPLHAARLTFPHPRDPARRVTVEAPVPGDLREVLELLERGGE